MSATMKQSKLVERNYDLCSSGKRTYDFQVVLDWESTDHKFGMAYELTFENLVVVGIRTWNNYSRRVKEHLTAALRQLTRRH